MSKKVSIVTAYKNRWPQFEYTLKTIKKSKYTNFELVVVDDGSDDEHRLEERLKQYDFPITLIRIDDNNKFYVNPCIPFNVGFLHATGDVVLMQNPECFHLGQVIAKAATIQDNEYLVFSCYNTGKDLSEVIRGITDADFKQINDSIVPTVDRQAMSCEENAWYNHPIYREAKLHFAAAISRADLNDLGGFDELYAFGVAYDDNDIRDRIIRKGMNITYCTVPIVVHQYHGVGNYTEHHPVISQLYQAFNQQLFVRYTQKETSYKANEQKSLAKMVQSTITKFNQ
jgi:glycosyltransferase involved in cell wall biosynthesis